jgi:hypothetical protein
MARIMQNYRPELVARYPHLFNGGYHGGNHTQSIRNAAKDGRTCWSAPALERLFTRIEAALAKGGGSLPVPETSEKYDTLRFYGAVTFQTIPD